MSRADRYAVHVREISAAVRELTGDDRPHYMVWDRELKKTVPFGGYSSLDGAQRRAYRMNHPVGWDTGEFTLCLGCADVHRPGKTTDRAGWRPVQGNIHQVCDWCLFVLMRTDTRVKSCGSLGDHGPHTHGTPDLRCPGNGPFMDTGMKKLEPDTYPGPPCVCSDSVWSSLGYCPPRRHREYSHCPVRNGSIEETEER
jgi:hypothetical protein